MSTQNLPYIVIVDSPSATAADTAEVSGGEALIKDGAGNQLFKFKTNKGIDGSREFGLAESPKDADFAVSAATVGLETALTIVQDVDEPGGDGLAQVRVAYTAVTGDTTTTIADKLVDLINKHKSIKVTASNVANTITLVGDANYPLWSVVNTSNLGAETSGMAATTASADGALANDQQAITVAASAGFSAGDTVTLAGFAAGDGDYVIASIASGTSIVLWNEGSDIDATSGARTVTLKSQDRKHAADDLIAAGIKASFQKDSNGNPIEFTAGATYLESKFSFMAPKGYGGFNNQTSDQEHLLKVYVKQSDATAANFSKALDGLDAVIAAI